MNYETKRDVFDKLLNEYVDDEIRIDGLVYEPDQHIGELDREYFTTRYAAALPDDLPVIPFRVAEVIKTNQADTELTIVLMRAKTGHQPDDYWINNHQNTFARAWVLGVWRVEETGKIVKLEAEK